MSLYFKTENNDFKKVLSLIPAIYKNDFKKIETKGQFDLKGKMEGLYRGSVYPKMDIVAISPIVESAHTINERIEIESLLQVSEEIQRLLSVWTLK